MSQTRNGGTGGLETFVYPTSGQQVRTVEIDDDPWFVLADVAKILGYRDGEKAARLLRPGQINTLPEGIAAELGQRGGRAPKIISEGGLYRLIMRSNLDEAEKFQDWVTDEVLPSIRKTGGYSVDLSSPAGVLALAEQYTACARALVAAEQQAKEGAVFKRAIEAGTGLSLREFHKKYFSAVTERQFFEHLYERGFLIDQRGKGTWDPKRRKFRDGAQHKHPKAKGKEYFYRHGKVVDGVRRENTYVRAGDPEIALRDALVSQGLPANEQTALFEIGAGS